MGRSTFKNHPSTLNFYFSREICLRLFLLKMEKPEAAQENPVNPKKIRHRRKQLYNNIKTQLEFYFSDSNLAKDRFIREKTKENDGGKFCFSNVFL